MKSCEYNSICKTYNDDCIVKKWVENTPTRKFTRFRLEHFYYKVGTVDCVECNFYCGFCFVRTKNPKLIENNDSIDNFKKIFPDLTQDCYEKFEERQYVYLTPKNVIKGFKTYYNECDAKRFRISGGEPTLCPNFLIKFLELFQNEFREDKDVRFILETNGSFLGSNKKYLNNLSKFKKFLHIRISLKAPTLEKFKKVQIDHKRIEKKFEDSRKSLVYCDALGFNYHPVYIVDLMDIDDFSIIKESLSKLNLSRFDISMIEFERLFIYDHIIKRIKNLKSIKSCLKSRFKSYKNYKFYKKYLKGLI
ncbi:MAG: radical SAM protein [Promethearchaeota archaeon]